MKTKYLVLPMLFLFSSLVTAQTAPLTKTNNISKAKAYLESILNENQKYVLAQGPDFFKQKGKGQQPQMTIIACSDSRVHTNQLNSSPEGSVFTIKNIGNQLETASGSVKYGVKYLHTPLLLILGHSDCGAITAATSDFSKLEPALIKELNSLNLSKGLSNIDGVKRNVHNQVASSMKLFKSEINNNKLLVVGAVYDFSNDMKKGAGKLNIINIQGKHVD